MTARTDGASGAEAQRRPRGLEERHFTKLADQGFGDPQNSYAFSMAWFDDALYVGTVRNMFVLVNASPPREPARLSPWPVRIPDSAFSMDLRAEVWRYGRGDSWERALVSPFVDGLDGKPVPRDIGYRDMTVFRAPGESREHLYLATASSDSRGPGAHVLRLEGDGAVPVSEPGLGDQGVSTFRTLLGLDDCMLIAPTGSGRAWNAADAPAVHTTTDPLSRKWRAIAQPGFGDGGNHAVYAMAAFHDNVYVGTLNPITGYEVWRSPMRGGRPEGWTRVVHGGAHRGNLNEAAMTMCAFGDALYVGSGISNGGYDRTHGVGPGAAEIIRIYPDDSWELVVGEPRSTPEGRMAPVSGYGPGFDNPFAGYLWSMAVHDGHLYAGTFDSTIFALWADLARQPVDRQMRLRRFGLDRFVQRHAGFDLYRTADGVHWSPVTRNGFGNPYNYGVRTLVSTPRGLFVGTANPFGPDVAARLAHGWDYVPNPRGGLEVWLGAAHDEGAQDLPSDVKEVPHVAATANRWGGRATAALRDRINDAYDQKMYSPLTDELYDGSDFYNFGYWHDDTQSLERACENLMAELLALVPEKAAPVVDVACGKGATTRYLTRHWDPADVTGINLSAKQLETCRRNAPRCRFLEMDATRLEFDDDSIGTLVSVEAACHFDTRRAFLTEALRVLAPGGRIALSDILLTWWAEDKSPVFVADNHLESPAEYRGLLHDIGYEDIVVRDVTEHTWDAYVRHLTQYVLGKLRIGEIDRVRARMMLRGLYRRRVPTVTGYVLVGARKGAAS